MLIDSFAGEASRRSHERLAQVLKDEGTAAHRSADHLEKLTTYPQAVTPSAHTKEAILAKIADCYVGEPWHVASFHLARLRDSGLEEPSRLRRQAAALLDAAEILGSLLRWYEVRRASIKTRDLTNDTIAAIMYAWKLKPRETTKQLTRHGFNVTEGRLKEAIGRTPGLGQPQGNEKPLVFYIPELRRYE